MAQPHGTEHRKNQQADHARAMLQPLIAGERTPEFVEHRQELGADTAFVREEIPQNVGRNAERERNNKQQDASPRSSPRRPRNRERLAQRRCGTRVPLDRQPIGQPTRRELTCGRNTRRHSRSSGSATNTVSGSHTKSCVRAYEGTTARTNSGRSGAIAPTAIAAGISGVRRNGSATTA